MADTPPISPTTKLEKPSSKKFEQARSPSPKPIIGKPRKISPYVDIRVSVDSYIKEPRVEGENDVRTPTPVARSLKKKVSSEPTLAVAIEDVYDKLEQGELEQDCVSLPVQDATEEDKAEADKDHAEVANDKVEVATNSTEATNGTIEVANDIKEVYNDVIEPDQGEVEAVDSRPETTNTNTESERAPSEMLVSVPASPAGVYSATTQTTPTLHATIPKVGGLKMVGTSPGRLESMVSIPTDDEEARDVVSDIAPKHRFKRSATMITNVSTALGAMGPEPNKVQSMASFRKKAAMLGKATSVIKGSKGMGVTDNAMITIDSCKLYEVLKPLFITMKIAGLFFIRPQGEALFQRKGLLKHVTGQQIYCIVIFAIMCLNWFRSILSFNNHETFGYVVFFKLLWCIFWYECASRSLFANMMWWKKEKGLQELFITIERSCYADGIIPYEAGLRKAMYWVFFSVVIGCLSITAVFTYGFFGSPKIQLLFDTVLLPVPSDISYIVVYKGFLLAIIIWSVIVAGLSLAFYTIVCYILYKEFQNFSRTFGMKIGPEGEFEDDLQKFRITHQNKSLLVHQADGCFKYYVANTYMSNSPLICLLLYNLLDSNQEFLYRLMGMYWVAIVLIQTVILSVAAIALNTQVTAINQ